MESTKFPVKPKVRGVRLAKQNKYYYWHVSISIYGDIERKFFSIFQLGYDEAYKQACEQRAAWEQELKDNPEPQYRDVVRKSRCKLCGCTLKKDKIDFCNNACEKEYERVNPTKIRVFNIRGNNNNEKKVK